MTKKLLVATDFSDNARQAIERAAQLAAEHGAKLTLLHVMSGPSLNALRELFPASVDAEKTLINDAQNLLDQLAADIAAASGADIDTQVLLGQTVGEILSASEQADMLVLGAQGQNPLRDRLLGTTTERLLRKCNRPILVVKRPPQGPYERVLIPVDFTPHSALALKTALRVAPRADMTIVHAFAAPFEGRLWLAGVAEEEIQDYRIRARRLALNAIEKLIQDCDAAPARFAREVEHGEAAPVVLAQEAQRDADLIVIGKHGQSVVEHLLLGSVTRHVLADSNCDVLVICEVGTAPAA